MVSRMFKVDFAEKKYGVALSREDPQFLKIVEDGIHHRDDMHYETNNRSQAELSLIHI